MLSSLSIPYSVRVRDLLAILFALLIGYADFCTAQTVTSITPSGLGTIVSPNGATYNILGGTRTNSNLFHSLGRFSVGNGDTANFQNSAGNPYTSNILTRVTDGFQSTIDGAIKTTGFGAANLFLLNPAGVVFNPGASLDVGGSFHVTTADYIDLQNGGRFYADPEFTSTLTAAAPSAFGFLPTNTGLSSIIFDGANLTVPDQKSITAVAASNFQTNINVKAGILNAPSGRVELTQIRPGETAPFSQATSIQSTQSGLAVTLPQGFDPAQDVMIRSGVFIAKTATIDTLGSGGNITIDAAQVEIRDGAGVISDSPFLGFTDAGDISINARDFIYVGGQHPSLPLVSSRISSSSALSSGSAGAIRLTTNDLTIDGGSVNSRISIASPFSTPDPGQVNIDVNTLSVKNGGQIGATGLFGPGSRGGAVTINAGDSISVTGAKDQLLSTIGSSTFDGDDAGDINLNTAKLNLSGLISTDSAGFSPNTGDAGTINIRAADIHVFGPGRISSSTTSDGDAGNINIGTTNLTVVGEISTTSGGLLADRGNAGAINITAQNVGVSNQGIITSKSSTDGNAGTIAISSSNLSIQGEISSSTSRSFSGAGNGGTISLTADNIQVSRQGLVTTGTTSDGDAGNISINANKNLLVQQGSQILSNTADATGNGGNIDIRAESLVITDQDSAISAASQRNVMRAASGLGNAGSINIDAETLNSRNSGKISTSTQTDGNAGKIRISAGNFSLENNATVESTSGSLDSNGQILVGNGNAGRINITADNLRATNGSAITAVTHGTGLGGAINIATTQTELSNNSNITAASTSSTLDTAQDPNAGLSGNIAIQATRFFRLGRGSSVSVTTQRANAGSINMQVGTLLHLIDSSIATSVANGTGNGGDITIDPDFVVLENGSNISANARQGAGGNIFIVADFFFNSFSPDSIVSASSEQGIDGTVVIRSPESDITSSTLRLPESFLDASAILPERCAAKSGKSGSFIIKDREGIPPHPDTILPSSYHNVEGSKTPKPNPSQKPSFSSWLLGQYNLEIPDAGGCNPRT